jgi:hypothetical protein
MHASIIYLSVRVPRPDETGVVADVPDTLDQPALRGELRRESTSPP